MDRFGGRLANLEILLWIVASVLGFAVFLIVVPGLFNFSSGTTAAAQSTATPRPTLTPIRTATRIPLPPSPKSKTPIPLPTIGPEAKAFSFAADVRRSGWFTGGETDPHWGDRNLHAGTYKGQTFESLVYFDLVGLAPGSKILYAEVDLVGLSRTNIGFDGAWSVQWLPVDFVSQWIGRPAAEFKAVRTADKIGSTLTVADLDEGQINQFVFTPEQFRLLSNAVETTGHVGLRIEGPTGTDQNLFTWDAGDRDATAAMRPMLRIIAVPTDFVYITTTPMPQNVVTAAAVIAQATQSAGKYGTPTPLPRKYATVPPMIPITPQPTPANEQTTIAQAIYATAVAMTTGTFTPTPLNLATITPTPSLTPTPAFVTFAQFTPIPTSTLALSPTPVSLLEFRKTPIPPESGLIGNIAFRTDRDGTQPQIWVMQPNGAPIGKLTGDELYRIAEVHDLYSPDYLFHLDIGKDVQDKWQISVFDVTKGIFSPLITEDKRAYGIGSYHPAWSPAGDKIAYVSEQTNNSEIYIYDVGTKRSNRITTSPPDPVRGYSPYNKHPSWSPDGKQIVFFSDRDNGRKQIWIMNADGGGLRSLRPTTYNDWDPVWIKR